MKKIAFVFTLITTILLGSNRLVAQTTVISAEKKTNLSMAIPPTIIYKAAKKYADLVPITLSEDKQIIVSYPDPRDISERSKPTYLKKGYYLDNRGISPNTAFIALTYEEYAQLKTAPSIEQLMKLIVNRNPIKKMYRCDKIFDARENTDKLIEIIDKKFANSEKMK